MANVILLQKGDLKKSDFTNDNSNNKEGIGIRVSTDSGNLLQKRPTGLYYGIEAPPDTRNLYVSSSTGDDANKGTRAEPLRTIREAIIRNNVGSSFTIHLFEDDTHDILASWGAIGNGKLITFRPYGPNMDTASARNPRMSFEFFRSEDVHRPRVQLIDDASIYDGNTLKERMGLTANTAPATGFIYSMAIHWDLTNTPDLPINRSNQQVFGHYVNTYNVGSVFELGNHFYYQTVGGSCEINFDHCKVITTNGNKLLYLTNSGVLNLSIHNTGRSGQLSDAVTPQGQTPLTLMTSSSLSEINDTLHLGDKASIVTTERVFSNVNLG